MGRVLQISETGNNSGTPFSAIRKSLLRCGLRLRGGGIRISSPTRLFETIGDQPRVATSPSGNDHPLPLMTKGDGYRLVA